MHYSAYPVRLSILTGYKFRHDSVLKVLVNAILKQVHDKKLEKPPSAEVKFVKNGTKTTNKKKRTIGILDKAKDWILHCDLGGHQEPFQLASLLLLRDPT